ncbi:hypothetical protein SLS60_011154 [Paraconiothyrium brasiliense]|uniref:Uncharacterized protein n=1 Tax=Paraconiothyrium brasiliense TaxID=300254 RepID=A0ABR3QKY2_9PLEO
MDAECATDNVWAGAGHPPSDDNIPSQASPPHHRLIGPAAEVIEKTAQGEAATDDDHQVERKSNIGSKICKGRKILAVKAWRARYALLVIFGYACWMIRTLLMIDAAAVGVRGVLMSTHATTTYRIEGIKSQQSLLLDKCVDLQEVHLQKRPFETHLKCLTRAANIAQDHYANLPYYSSPVVVDCTTMWAHAVMLIEDIPSKAGTSWTIIGSFATYLLSEVLFMWMYSRHLQMTHEQYRSGTTTAATYAIHFGVIFLCYAELRTVWWTRSSSIHRLLWAFREVRTIYLETLEESIRKIEMEFNGISKFRRDGSTADKSHGEIILDENAVAEEDRADDPFTSAVLHISPDSSLHEDVERMREYLHRKQATLKMKPKSLRPHGVTLREFDDNNLSPSPNSDSGWTVVTSSEYEPVVLPIMDDPHVDDESAGIPTPAISSDEEEQTIEDGAADSV